MKRNLLLLLAILILLPLTSCGKTEPEAPDTPISPERRANYEYPDDYLSSEIYSMKNILRDTENYYKAISKACPDFSETETEADALALWGCDLWDYLSVGNAETFLLTSGAEANSFWDIPTPDISKLKENVLSGLSEYHDHYLEPRG